CLNLTKFNTEPSGLTNKLNQKHMKQKLLSLVFVLTCLIGMSYAQNRQVSGRVTSAADGSAIAGVSVSVVGTTTATQTDGSGNYSISVSNGATLNFSFVGYQTQRVNVGNQSVINVQLVNDSEALDEVVVVGYGTQLKKNLTTSISSVGEKDLREIPVANIQQALQGKAAGVNITSVGGRPGAPIS